MKMNLMFSQLQAARYFSAEKSNLPKKYYPPFQIPLKFTLKLLLYKSQTIIY